MGRPSDARERLLEAATNLIWVEGYAALTVDGVCERAGVRKGSFYHFFESKEQLVLATLDAHWARRRPALDALFSPSLAPLERLRRYFQSVLERQLEHKARTGQLLGCFFNAVAVGAAQQSPEIVRKVQGILATYERYYESALLEAAARGELAGDDLRGKARSLFALMEGVLAQARIQDDPELIRTLGHRAFELLGIAERWAA
jgi:TetR/AcrR family transcriptional repressor of nem operon